MEPGRDGRSNLPFPLDGGSRNPARCADRLQVHPSGRLAQHHGMVCCTVPSQFLCKGLPNPRNRAGRMEYPHPGSWRVYSLECFPVLEPGAAGGRTKTSALAFQIPPAGLALGGVLPGSKDQRPWNRLGCGICPAGSPAAGKTVTDSKTKILCDGTGCLRGRKNPGNAAILRRPAHPDDGAASWCRIFPKPTWIFPL